MKVLGQLKVRSQTKEFSVLSCLTKFIAMQYLGHSSLSLKVVSFII